MDEQLPSNDLITIQKQNQELLKELVAGQALLLEYEKNRQKRDKRKVWITIIKYIFWVVVILWSFMFTQKLMNNMLGGITGGLPNMENFDLSSLMEGGMNSGMQQKLEKYLGK